MIQIMNEIFNNAPCGFLSFTDDGLIVMVNNTLLKLLGYELEELENKKVELILPIASRIFYQTHFFPMLKLHGVVEEIYFSLRSKQGKDIPMLINAVRREKDGKIFNDCIFISIHQRIQYEDEILKAKKVAEAAILAQKEAEMELRKLYSQLQMELIERQQAEKIISQQAAREVVLRNMTQKIHESLDLTDIFQIATEGIRLCFEADRVGIFKFDPNSNFSKGEFISESVRENFNSIMGITIEDHCFGEQYAIEYQKEKIYIIENINIADIQSCHRKLLHTLQIKSNLVMSLVSDEHLWGLLCVHQCSNIRSWQEFEIYFIQQVVNQLAIAIQKRNLFKQLQTELLERKIVEVKLKETNESLLNSNRKLERATKAKSEFLANMSHEIRTPMNGVIGMTQLLSMSNLSDEQKDLVDTIKHSGEALVTIINDILDFSKIESGMLELEKHPFVLKNIFKSVCHLFTKQAIDKGINLTYQIDDNLPKTFLGDSTRFRQILLNLTGNSLKFTENGSITISVNSRSPLIVDNDIFELIIAVKDTGIGIDGDRIEKLFKAFSQADASISRKYGGTGLGLAISKSLIGLMGGNIWVESKGNIGGNPPDNWILESTTEGTTFYFTLKLQAVADSEIKPENLPEKTLVTTTDKKSSLTILLAEDNKVNQKVALLTLKKLGYQADVANNGVEVLEMLEKQFYDVILMDMQMPKMDGITATEVIRKSTQPQPYIIALTANALDEDRENCLAVGMNAYISKPIAINKLREVLEIQD